jgi:hypothetical protein
MNMSFHYTKLAPSHGTLKNCSPQLFIPQGYLPSVNCECETSKAVFPLLCINLILPFMHEVCFLSPPSPKLPSLHVSPLIFISIVHNSPSHRFIHGIQHIARESTKNFPNDSSTRSCIFHP